MMRSPSSESGGDHPPFRQLADHLRRGASSARPARYSEIGEVADSADRMVKVEPANCRC
jgi:hypothetical protein